MFTVQDIKAIDVYMGGGGRGLRAAAAKGPLVRCLRWMVGGVGASVSPIPSYSSFLSSPTLPQLLLNLARKRKGDGMNVFRYICVGEKGK